MSFLKLFNFFFRQLRLLYYLIVFILHLTVVCIPKLQLLIWMYTLFWTFIQILKNIPYLYIIFNIKWFIPNPRHTSIIDRTADILGVLKLHLNNISRNRFGGNENRTFLILAETILGGNKNQDFWRKRWPPAPRFEIKLNNTIL